ncbi:MAG: YaiO family outer membrane beta-barrel protein, partial [Nevskiales bacterium]
MAKKTLARRITAGSAGLLLAAGLSAGQANAQISHEGREIRDQNDNEWSITTLYGRSFLNQGRQDWDDLDIEALGRPIPELIIGLRSIARHREDDTDVLYDTSLAFFPLEVLELHWGLTLTPGADFSPRQIHNFGIEWRASWLVSLLFDLERLNYSAGPVDQYTQGITFWFTDDDKTYLSSEYTYGRAFHDRYFDAVNFKMTVGLPKNHKLRFGVYHGKQAEQDPTVPGTLLLTSDIVSAYYQLPLGEHVELIMGLEYENLRNIYDRS